MKSASRPGSVMFIASVCRSSDSSGDSDTTCWKLVLMFRASASISRRSASLVSSVGGADARAQVRLRRDDLVERQPRQPLDDQAQAAVGQLEHLVDVRRGADAVQIGLRRLLDRRVALREHARSACRSAIASSISRTELSRATASGMNEFGKRTVSRSGRIGSSDGIESGRSPIETSSALRVRISSLMATLLSEVDLRRPEPCGPPRPNPLEPRCKRHGDGRTPGRTQKVKRRLRM